MCRLIQNDNIFFNHITGERKIIDIDDERPFMDGIWALKRYEMVVDSRGEYIGFMYHGKFIPAGEDV